MVPWVEFWVKINQLMRFQMFGLFYFSYLSIKLLLNSSKLFSNELNLTKDIQVLQILMELNLQVFWKYLGLGDASSDFFP